MELGLVSAILSQYSFEEVVDFAAKTGFRCIEMCCWPKEKVSRRYAGVTHIDIDNLTNEKIIYYSDYINKKRIKISSLGYYPNPLDPNEEVAKTAQVHIMKLIDTAVKMDIPMITTFIGKNKNKSVEDNLDIFEKVWKPIIAYAESCKVKVAIENCPMLYTKDEWPGGNNLASTPYIWKEMFRRIPSDYFGLNYDPSHPLLLGADYIKPIFEFKDKIFHVHFKDIMIYKDKVDEYGRFSYPSLWHAPKLPGLGQIDFAKMCSALNDIGYKGAACIEVEDRSYEGSRAEIERGIEQAYRYMRQFVPNENGNNEI